MIYSKKQTTYFKFFLQSHLKPDFLLRFVYNNIFAMPKLHTLLLEIKKKHITVFEYAVFNVALEQLFLKKLLNTRRFFTRLNFNSGLTTGLMLRNLPFKYKNLNFILYAINLSTNNIFLFLTLYLAFFQKNKKNFLVKLNKISLKKKKTYKVTIAQQPSLRFFMIKNLKRSFLTRLTVHFYFSGTSLNEVLYFLSFLNFNFIFFNKLKRQFKSTPQFLFLWYIFLKKEKIN